MGKSTYVAKHLALAVAFVLVWTSVVFLVLYAGPLDPAQAVAGLGATPEELQQVREQFGLTDPLVEQYRRFMLDKLTFSFDDSWILGPQFGEGSGASDAEVYDGNLAIPFARTAWLWGWALLGALIIGLPIGLYAGFNPGSWGESVVSAGGIVSRALPAYVLAVVLLDVLQASEDLLFGFNWGTFLVDTQDAVGRPILQDPIPIGALTDPEGFLLAFKLILPAAVALGATLLGVVMQIGLVAARETDLDDLTTRLTTVAGIRERWVVVKRLAWHAVSPLIADMRATAGLLVVGAIVVEWTFQNSGAGYLLVTALFNGDLPLVGSIMFVFILLLAGINFLRTVLSASIHDSDCSNGDLKQRTARPTAGWTALVSTIAVLRRPLDGLFDNQLQYANGSESDGKHQSADLTSLVQQLKTRPRPAVLWALGIIILVVVEMGALIDAVTVMLPGVGAELVDLPTLLSRELIPNQGYRTPETGWQGTFLGLSPAYAWAVRVLLVYAYAVAWLAWLWFGYRIYRVEYRGTARTSIDAAFGRFRTHRWGRMGFAVVFVFVVAAVFAPTLGPAVGPKTLIEEDRKEYLEREITYFDEESGEVVSTSFRFIQSDLRSTGSSSQNIGPLSYGPYGGFHPFGTTGDGTDLFTIMLYGARTYFVIGVVALGLSSVVAVGFVGSRAILGRVADSVAEVTSAAVSAVPVVPMLFVVSFVVAPLGILDDNYAHALLFAVAFALFLWPDIWRAIAGSGVAPVRTESAETPESDSHAGLSWRSRISSVVAPLLVYWSLSFGSLVIVTGAVAYPAILLQPLTGWMSLFRAGPEITSASWHVAAISGLALVLVAVGFNALGVGIRDTIDPGRGTATPTASETPEKEPPAPAPADQRDDDQQASPVFGRSRWLPDHITLGSNVRHRDE